MSLSLVTYDSLKYLLSLVKVYQDLGILKYHCTSIRDTSYILELPNLFISYLCII